MKVFIANRGEIAARIMQTCRRQGVPTVWPAVASDTVGLAGELSETCLPLDAAGDYLNSELMVSLAQQSGATHVHPGYGYLSENAAFAKAVEKAGLVFLGPTADTIAAMGDKTQARQLMEKAQVPVVPGSHEATAEAAKDIGFPLLIKPLAGGGGKGMRVVNHLKDFEEELAASKREAQRAFADDRVFLERYLPVARHVEVQILGDGRGHVCHVGTRDCSLQRRHQKIVEECPAPQLEPSLRTRIEEAAVAAGQALNYRSAGTVEFIVDDNDFFFLEVNTRLQVEHPVTEMVYGLDLVDAQLKIARGESLPTDITPKGHAFEARIYAEDPTQQFLPALGHIRRLDLPEGPGLRVDRGVALNSEVGLEFDPMLMKICAWGENREVARQRLVQALEDFCLHGVSHNGGFLLDVLEHQDFVSASIHTRWIETQDLTAQPSDQHFLALPLASSAPTSGGQTSHTTSKTFLEGNPFRLETGS